MDPLSPLGNLKCLLSCTWLLLAFVTALAQGQQIATCPSATSWLNNEDGQSPCDVASALLTPCTSTPIAPLAGEMFYSNNEPLCSCNTVMFNLFSACAYCQGGDPSDFKDWTLNCASASYMSFPQGSLRISVKTPLWTFTNVTSDGTFDLISIQKAAAPSSHRWTTIQILIPIIAVGGTVLVSSGAAYYWFRRVQRKYQPIHDHSRATSASQLSFYTYPSQSSKKSSSSTKSRHSKPRGHAWEQATLRNSKKFGIFGPSATRVRSAGRGAGWTINEEDEEGHHSRGLSSTSLSLIQEEPEVGPGQVPTSSTTSVVVNGDQSFLPVRKGKTGSPRVSDDVVGSVREHDSVPTFHSTGPLPAIQDSPQVNRNNVRPTRGVQGERPPLVHIVSSPPHRGFHIDDTDSAKSPVNTEQPAGGSIPVLHPLATTTTATSAVPRNEQSVVLISRRPGENFTIPTSSMPVSPTSTEGWETVVSSSDNQVFSRWPPARSDNSSILPASLTRATGPAESQSSSSPGSGGDALFPPSVRAAGYTSTAWQGRGSGAPSLPSSHSSAYTVPNPFTFNSRRENPLRGTAVQFNSARATRQPFDIDG